jgi:hypothetical protein
MAAAELDTMEPLEQHHVQSKGKQQHHHKKRKEVPIVTEPEEQQETVSQRTVTFAEPETVESTQPLKRKKTSSSKKNNKHGIAIESEQDSVSSQHDMPTSLLSETLTEPEFHQPRRLHPDEEPDDIFTPDDTTHVHNNNNIKQSSPLWPAFGRADVPEVSTPEARPDVVAPPPSGPSRLLDFTRSKPAGKKGGPLVAAPLDAPASDSYWWAAEARPFEQMPPTSPRWDVGAPGIFYVHGQHVRALCVARNTSEAQDLLEREIAFNTPSDAQPELDCAIVRLDVAKPMRAVLCARHTHVPEEDQNQLVSFMGARQEEEEQGEQADDAMSPQQQLTQEQRARAAAPGPRTANAANSLSVYYVNDRFSGICVARSVKDAIAAFDDDRFYCAEPPCSKRPYRVNKLDLGNTSDASFSLFLCNCKRG